MGVIESTGYKKEYFNISGKDCCMYGKIDGVKTVIKGLSGYISDIQLKKGKDKNGDIKHKYILTLVDDNPPTDDTVRNVVEFSEGTYLCERIWNQLLSLQHNEPISIFVYESNKIKNSPGCTIQVNKKSLPFTFSEWDEVKREYKGMPSGKANDPVRLEFWRDKVFDNIFTNLLGRAWDGEILIDRSLQESLSIPNSSEPTYSLEAMQALNAVKKKLPAYEAAGDPERLAAAWKQMRDYIVENLKGYNPNNQTSGDGPVLIQALIAVQEVLDRISKSGEPLRLELDGSWGVEDLPF